MPNLTTFGFEAEFQVNAADVITHLHARDLAGTNRLHSYHCDCEHCEFRNGYAFRGQTDSSCSGEIISDIFGEGGSDYDAPSLMQELCDAAVEVDAEPGQNSGFHVHVGITHLAYSQLHSIFWQLLRWEPTLSRIAGGRWQQQRGGMNQTIRNCVQGMWNDLRGYESLTTEALDACDADETFRAQMFQQHQCADRHSNLNVSARRQPTWEFRLWNSTRAAWRMELFTSLSVALVDPRVAANLAELHAPRRFRLPATGVEHIATACDNAGHSRTAELLTRQADYLNDRAATAPNVLTSL